MAPQAMHDPKCLLYCIGSTKCGTTWVHSILAEHPEVHAPAGKEVHYWDTVRPPFFREPLVHDRLAQLRLAPLDWAVRLGSSLSASWRSKYEQLQRFRRMYASSQYDHGAYLNFLFADREGERVVLDCTPNYVLLGTRTFEEMHALHSNARFLMIMRDPVERLWSSVRFESRRLKGDSKALLKALVRRFDDALSDDYDPLLRKSRYEVTWKALEKAVPMERILYLFYEDLGGPAAWNTLFEFVGIMPIAVDFERRLNVGRAVGGRPDAPIWGKAREVLSPTYDAVRIRFGPRVPVSWR